MLGTSFYLSGISCHDIMLHPSGLNTCTNYYQMYQTIKRQRIIYTGVHQTEAHTAKGTLLGSYNTYFRFEFVLLNQTI